MSGASIILLLLLTVTILFNIAGFGREWEFERSPNTNICYEVRSDLSTPFFGWSDSMNPVNDSFCEDEK